MHLNKIPYTIGFLLLLSCKEKKLGSLQPLSNFEEEKSFSDSIVSEGNSVKINNWETNSPSLDLKPLLDHKIAGLSIINEKVTDPYKKYGLDFSTVCYCNSPSMYINTIDKEFIVFNYCDSKNTMKLFKVKERMNTL